MSSNFLCPAQNTTKQTTYSGITYFHSRSVSQGTSVSSIIQSLLLRITDNGMKDVWGIFVRLKIVRVKVFLSYDLNSFSFLMNNWKKKEVLTCQYITKHLQDKHSKCYTVLLDLLFQTKNKNQVDNQNLPKYHICRGKSVQVSCQHRGGPRGCKERPSEPASQGRHTLWHSSILP